MSRKTHPVIHAARYLICFSLLSPPGLEARGSLEQCQSLSRQLDRYQQLRRNGGSASQMNNWKRKIREITQRQHELDCKAWGNRAR